MVDQLEVQGAIDTNRGMAYKASNRIFLIFLSMEDRDKHKTCDIARMECH